jgi:hypothetical protein
LIDRNAGLRRFIGLVRIPVTPCRSANILLCQRVENNGGLLSAVGVVDVFTFGRNEDSANFKAVTFLTGHQGDVGPHIVVIEMVTEDLTVVAKTNFLSFSYAHSVDTSAPGAFQLTTNFDIGLSMLPYLGTYTVHAVVDSIAVAKTFITLRRE